MCQIRSIKSSNGAIHNWFNPILLLALLASAGLGGCSYFSPDTTPSEVHDSSGVSDAALPPEDGAASDGLAPSPSQPPQGPVELIWAIPEQPVDGYLISYGGSAENLDQEAFVESAQLQIVEHPSFGKVYRHLITQVPATGALFVSISAYRGNRLSERGEVRRVDSQPPAEK
jgi:hypothetical protein